MDKKLSFDIQQGALLASNKSFQTEISRLRKKFGINTKDGYKPRLALADIRIDIKRLLVKLKLGMNWLDGVERYIITGDINLLLPKFSVRIRSIPDKFDQLEEISLVIDKTTTLNDVGFMWPAVKVLQEGLPEKSYLRRRKSNNIEHGLFALALLNKKASYKEIVANLNQKFALNEQDQYDLANLPDLLKNTKRKLSK